MNHSRFRVVLCLMHTTSVFASSPRDRVRTIWNNPGSARVYPGLQVPINSCTKKDAVYIKNKNPSLHSTLNATFFMQCADNAVADSSDSAVIYCHSKKLHLKISRVCCCLWTMMWNFPPCLFATVTKSLIWWHSILHEEASPSGWITVTKWVCSISLLT